MSTTLSKEKDEGQVQVALLASTYEKQVEGPVLEQELRVRAVKEGHGRDLLVCFCVHLVHKQERKSANYSKSACVHFSDSPRRKNPGKEVWFLWMR